MLTVTTSTAVIIAIRIIISTTIVAWHNQSKLVSHPGSGRVAAGSSTVATELASGFEVAGFRV